MSSAAPSSSPPTAAAAAAAPLARKPGQKRFQPVVRRPHARTPPPPVSPPPPGGSKHRAALAEGRFQRQGGSVSSLPPYEALFDTANDRPDELDLAEESEGSPGEQLHSCASVLPPAPVLHPSLESLENSTSSLDDAELEFDDSIQLDRLVLRSSLALATAQSVLAGALGARGAVLDLNTREAEGTLGLDRIETMTKIRMRRDEEQGASLEPLLSTVSTLIDALAQSSATVLPARRSNILSRRLEVGRGSVGALSATRVEAEWSTASSPRTTSGAPSSSSSPSSPAESFPEIGPRSSDTLDGLSPLVAGSSTPVGQSPLARFSFSNAGSSRLDGLDDDDAGASYASPSSLRRVNLGVRGGSPSKRPQELERDVFWPSSPSPSNRETPTDRDALDRDSLSTPTNPPSALPLVEPDALRAHTPLTPDPAVRATPSPSPPPFLSQPATTPSPTRHARSFSSFLPSLALPSLPSAITAATSSAEDTPPATAAATPPPSAAVSQLKALGASSPTPMPPSASAAKGWGWFGGASPST